MPNLAAVLKEEIRRLARREIKTQVGKTQKVAAQYRRDIAKLKRGLSQQEREIKLLKKQQDQTPKEEEPLKKQTGKRTMPPCHIQHLPGSN